jgi:hypothetical protein
LMINQLLSFFFVVRDSLNRPSRHSAQLKPYCCDYILFWRAEKCIFWKKFLLVPSHGGRGGGNLLAATKWVSMIKKREELNIRRRNHE